MSDAHESKVLDTQPILFFDGICGLCNRLVNIVLRLDRKQLIRFSPLQGETARAMLPPLPEDAREWSMVYWDGERVHTDSDANLVLCRDLGGVLSVLSVLRWIPRGVRDPVYRTLARTRYRWFGTLESCRVPSAEEEARFLP